MAIIDNGTSIVRVYDGDDEILELYDQGVLVHKRVTITFSGNGGLPSTRTSIRTYEVEQVIQPTSPTRSGYTFKGWYTSRIGGDQVTFPRYTPLNDTTFYAQWTGSTPGLTWQFNRELDPKELCVALGASIIGTSCSTLNQTEAVSGYHDGYDSCIEIICKGR